MRTVQRTYTLFGIAELEDEARQRAYTDWLAKGNDYPYASENCDTLEAFCNLFRIVCTNYRYDSCTYAYRFYTKHEADTEELSGVRLLAYLYNNFHAGLYKPKVYWTKDRKKRRRSRISVTCECPFTGVVSDEIILQPLMDFMRSPDTRNFKELMRDCLENFFRSCRDDCEYCESEEYFTDESHRNNWEYLIVSIRPTTGIKPLYTTIATVTMNLIVSAAIVLLNPYVTIYISYKIPPFALSVHIPDVSTSIYVEVDSKVLLGLPFCDKAFVR